MAGPEAAAPLAIWLPTISPSWLTSTYSTMAAAMAPNRLSRSSIPHSGHRLMCWRPIATSSTAACANTPSVVPTPSTSSLALPIFTGSTASSPGTARYTNKVAMATTLLMTGAQAGGPNTFRVFRIAMNTDDSP
ncbi:hypothetical protein BB170200_05182 [Mycobacterium marinum]|nr:hypothetical protein BB170200_05182 [Mycobacterium marinum]